ncbi:hypothetical protein HELRODRAFT_181042 [Helobdella robusta]|uniref:Uncharacterized protein n=1 Tax=Helobdella robusta TaxID=6412 RepID=T1FGK0_HELRO|nr:hypothetical protein HELRODRAFT_181042 [Helobdella robusta]ESN93296.1 hypothetical protein HELRODRAFT_181042 [Helobdella robusta]
MRKKKADKLVGRIESADSKKSQKIFNPNKSNLTKSQLQAIKYAEELRVHEGDLKNVHEPKETKESEKCPNVNVYAVKKLKLLQPALNKAECKVVVARPAPPDAPLKNPTIKLATPVADVFTITLYCKRILLLFLKDENEFLGGIQLNAKGQIIPYGLLGSVGDFVAQAMKRGVSQDVLRKVIGDGEDEKPPSSEAPVTNFEVKKKKKKRIFGTDLLREDKPLRNWEKHMRIRRYQQEYLACMLNKNVEDLAMNQGEMLRKVSEHQNIIDATLPFLEAGKGVRAGSEFWQEAVVVGSDPCTALHSTLTNTQKGYAPPISFVDTSSYILCREKGLQKDRIGLSTHKPWLRSNYLQQRMHQIDNLAYELNPHIPRTDGLIVLGQNHSSIQQQVECDKLRRLYRFGTAVASFDMNNKDDDNIGVVTNLQTCDDNDGVGDYGSDPTRRPSSGATTTAALTPRLPVTNFDPDEGIPQIRRVQNFVCGPSIIFGDFRATFCEKCHRGEDEDGAVGNDDGDAVFGCRCNHEDVDVRLLMECSINQKQQCKNPFDLDEPLISKFYFSPSPGFIIPGETSEFRFHFKSLESGIFQECWSFKTHPLLNAGRSLGVTLKGVVVRADDHFWTRQSIEKCLSKRESNQIAENIVRSVLLNVNKITSAVHGATSPVIPLLEVDIFIQKNVRKLNEDDDVTKADMTSTMMSNIHATLMYNNINDLIPTTNIKPVTNFELPETAQQQKSETGQTQQTQPEAGQPEGQQISNREPRQAAKTNTTRPIITNRSSNPVEQNQTLKPSSSLSSSSSPSSSFSSSSSSSSSSQPIVSVEDVWDLDVDTLKSLIMSLPGDCDEREMCLERLNATLLKMSYFVVQPCQQSLNNILRPATSGGCSAKLYDGIKYKEKFYSLAHNTILNLTSDLGLFLDDVTSLLT